MNNLLFPGQSLNYKPNDFSSSTITQPGTPNYYQEKQKQLRDQLNKSLQGGTTSLGGPGYQSYMNPTIYPTSLGGTKGALNGSSFSDRLSGNWNALNDEDKMSTITAGFNLAGLIANFFD